MNKPLPYDPALLRKRAESIISNVRELAQLGWTPATSSNFSLRLDGAHAAITVSGRDKGRLVEDDIMVVDFDANRVQADWHLLDDNTKPGSTVKVAASYKSVAGTKKVSKASSPLS